MAENPIRVLIVDDEESLRVPLAYWLAEACGYHVETAASGSQALEMLAADGCFDVILLDYLLPPPYNGITLMEEIKRHCLDSPVAFIIFTGWGLDTQVGVRALIAGAYRYLAKPFDREELAILIQSIVETRRTREKLKATSREKAWLESLLQVSQSVNSILELDKVLELILDEMRRVVVYDSASIQRSTDAGLEIIACRGFPNPDELLGHVFPPSDEYPNYRVWKRRQPLIEEDMQASHKARHVRGWLGVPLVYRDQAIGVITLDSKMPDFYDEDDARVAMIFANQAAIAIENAQLYGRTSKKLEQKVAALQTVSEINQLITSTLDLNEVLPLILDKAMELVHVQNGLLQLLDEETGELVIQSRTGGMLVPLERPRLKLGEGVTGKAAQERCSIIVHDATQPPWRDIYVEFWPGTRSELAVPLLIGERCIGVLNFGHPEPGYFSEDEREIVEGMAAQAAIAIHNAWLYEATKRRSQQLVALHEASKAIAAGFAAKRKLVLDRITEQAVERITGIEGPRAVRGAIMLYDEVANELQFESVYPPKVLRELESGAGEKRSLDKDKVPNGRIGITGRTVLAGKPQRVHDVRTDSDYIADNASTRSELAVPLVDGSKIIGVLSVESDQVGAFDADDEQALQGLADLAVIAIKNAGQAEQLSRTNAVALMGAWGADVVHDVNREVGAIRRAIFGLQQHVHLPPEVKERLQDIDRYASSLALPELPEQAPESGGALQFRDAPLLDEVIRAEVQDLQAVHPSVTLRLEQNCNGIRVAIHERWLRRIVRHLIHNAVKTFRANQETRLVAVRTSVQGSMAEVQVEDTGIGVRSEIIPMLFQQPIPQEDGRLGRGLLLVRFLAEQHGGYAKLIGTQPGKGACFAFSIPLAQPTAGSV